MRPKALLNLLNSVKLQELYPNEILIIDGSTNNETREMLNENSFENLSYFLVSNDHRGLTKQRNFGISKVSVASEIVCFLDDDTIIQSDYFKKIMETFSANIDAIGVGGVAVNENKWKENIYNYDTNRSIYTFKNFYIEESSRNKLRNILKLNSTSLPGVMPEFSHGKTCSYPLTGEIYPVDLLVGMSMNFRRKIFNTIKFSSYFEGYGLYEDADFSLRALNFGQNFINTSAKLKHFHDESGRPNKYTYGKMVVRNGWYVWRIKYPNPSLKAKIKWHCITVLLTIVRFCNVFTTNKKREAITETLGRFVGWLSLWFNKPKLVN